MNHSSRPRTRLLAAAFWLIVLGCSGRQDPADRRPADPTATVTGDDIPLDEGFTRLTLADFEPFPATESNWREERGVLSTTGKPKGYLHSRRSYGDFTWRGEFRFPQAAEVEASAPADQANTGFMLFIQEPHKVWPRSLEVQGKFVDIGEVRPNGGIPPLTASLDRSVLERARRPLGEWNRVEIECRAGAVTASLNGELVSQSEASELTEGLIGLQAENFPVEFRRLRIREGI